MAGFSLFFLPTLLIAAAVSDVTSFRIPNWLTGATALSFLPVALLAHMPSQEILSHLLAGAILFAAGFLLFSFKVFGGGDAKLMAAAGLWFGTAQMLPFLFLTAVVGGGLAVVVACWSVFMLSWEIEGDEAPFAGIGAKLRTLSPNVPYGFAFAVGGILAFRDSWWLHGTQ